MMTVDRSCAEPVVRDLAVIVSALALISNKLYLVPIIA